MLSRWLIAVYVLLPGTLVFGQTKTQSAPVPYQTISLTDKAIAVEDALAVISKQTGLTVADRRTTKKDPKISIAWDKITFWQAMSDLAKHTKSRLSIYQRDGAIALVDGVPLPYVSQHGPFRTTVDRVDAFRDFKSGIGRNRFTLSLTWEPTLKPYLVEVRPFTAEYSLNTKGRPFRYTGMGQGTRVVTGPRGVQLSDITTPLLPRSTEQLTTLRGSLSVTTATKMMKVTFKKMGTIFQKPKSLVEKKNGVEVTLRCGPLDTDRWYAEIDLTYPKDSPEFESFQQSNWVRNNKVYLVRADNPKFRFEVRPTDQEPPFVSSREASFKYFFTERKGQPRLGQANQWHLVYETPERIVQTNVPFEFKNVALP